MTYLAWQAVAARRLLGGLVSSASLDGEVVWLQVSGPPVFRIRADDPRVAAAWATLTEAVTWVYLSGFDTEARHRLFSGELARMDRPGQQFLVTLQRALESSKVAYEAYVQSSSRETLKALADLRKTVIEETQKVTQRAQDMTAGLWRDAAVMVAPFVLKIASDSSKPTPIWVSAGFYFAAATFIVLSFVLQWRINKAFFRSQKTSRRRWMETFYTYVSAQERDEIAEAPIKQAMTSYRETRRTLLIVYVVLVSVLIWFGIDTIRTSLFARPATTNIPSKELSTAPTAGSTTNPTAASGGIAPAQGPSQPTAAVPTKP